MDLFVSLMVYNSWECAYLLNLGMILAGWVWNIIYLFCKMPIHSNILAQRISWTEEWWGL